MSAQDMHHSARVIHQLTCHPTIYCIHLSYIDTVGNADMYRNKLERVFAGKGMTFVVEKKADANYAPCSAASVGK